MLRKPVVVLRMLIIAWIFTTVFAIYNRGISQEVREDARVHNERGLNYFNEAKFKLEASGKIDEAAIKYEEAAREFKNAIDKEPHYPQAYANLGRVYMFQKKYSEAAEQYENAVRLMPEDVNYRVALTSAYENLGRYDKAIQELEVAISLSPANYQKETLRGYIKSIKEKKKAQK